jgi:hypothetical protein
LPEIAIGTALFSGVQWAFKRADTERKKFEQGVKETYAKLESTPDKFLEKLNTQIKDSDSTVNKYKNMSIYGRIYGDTLLNVASNIASGTLKGKQMDVMLQQISASAKNSTTEFNALYLAAQNAGNADMTKLLSQLKLVYGAGQQAVSAFMQVQQLIAAGVDVSNANFKDPNTLRKLYGVAITNTQSQIDTLKKQHGAGSGIADPTKVLDARIKKEEKVLKTLEDQLKTMQDQAKVIQQQNDYYNKQTDLTNQIKEAQVSGQYIKAAQLRTVMGQQSAQFKQQQIMDAKQAQIDAKKAEIDSLNAKKQALDAANCSNR